MGKYYLFKLSIVGNDIKEKPYEQIKNDNIEYITYNKFLTKYYGTNIEDNEDYIVYINGESAFMILKEGLFDKNKVEEVFEILYDSIYMNRGEECEKNNNCEWESKIG